MAASSQRRTHEISRVTLDREDFNGDGAYRLLLWVKLIRAHNLLRRGKAWARKQAGTVRGDSPALQEYYTTLRWVQNPRWSPERVEIIGKDQRLGQASHNCPIEIEEREPGRVHRSLSLAQICGWLGLNLAKTRQYLLLAPHHERIPIPEIGGSVRGMGKTSGRQ